MDQNSDAFGHTERIPTLLLYKSIPTLHTRVLGAAAMNAACGVSFGAMIASIPTLTVYQPYISTSYQRPTDTHISTVYQADTAAGKLILVYQPNTRGSHPHRLVYQPHTGT